MRALFTVADGGHSHLYPLVPLARDLENRGHAVAVAAPPRLSEVAARLGLQVIPLPAPPTDADLDGPRSDVVSTPAAATPSLQRARTAVGRYLSDAARLAGFVASAAREWGADVLVRESRPGRPGWPGSSQISCRPVRLRAHAAKADGHAAW